MILSWRILIWFWMRRRPGGAISRILLFILVFLLICFRLLSLIIPLGWWWIRLFRLWKCFGVWTWVLWLRSWMRRTWWSWWGAWRGAIFSLTYLLFAMIFCWWRGITCFLIFRIILWRYLRLWQFLIVWNCSRRIWLNIFLRSICRGVFIWLIFI